MSDNVNRSADGLGFFGKLPSHGDFVSRRLPRGFTDPWDGWLQSVIANSRQQLENDWLDIYLTSPIWRFALSPGLCGDRPWSGVVMPSVDRVGRYFPLTLAVPLPVEANLMRLLSDAADWFERAEELALSTLEDDFDIDAFDASIQSLSPPVISVAPHVLVRPRNDRPAWQFSLSAVDGSTRNMACISQTLLANQYQSYSLWWTGGSERIDPSLLITEGLPPVSNFAGLLDGNWQQWGWGQVSLPRVNGTGETSEA